MIKVISGDSLSLSYTIQDEAGAAVDLTGGVIDWSISNPDGTDIVAKASPSNGVVLTDPSNGVATVTIDPSDTSTLKGIYALSAKFTDASSNVYTFEADAIEVR